MQIDFKLYPFSFVVGFTFGIFFYWLMGRVRPLLEQLRESAKEQREAAQVRRTSGLEDNHRRLTLRRAQGMHLAASLFSLDEILQEPRLLAPPVQVEPGKTGIQEDVISQTLPYMPMWPELASTYRAPTLGLVEAITGGSNVVIVGAAGAGKAVALAHLASLAANLKVQVDAGVNKVDAVPYLYHVADLQLPHDSTKDPLTIIINAASERAPVFDLGRLPGFVQQTFRSGSALLLIDGFDELEPQSQTQVTEWFKALLQAYPNIKIVTTGCPNQLNGLLGLDFHPLVLTRFDSSKARAWVKQYDVVDDQPIEDVETDKTITQEKIVLTDSQKIRLKKAKSGDVPSTGLLGKLVDSGLLISHSNNKLRFLHPVL